MGVEAALRAARAGAIVGFAGTSNVAAAAYGQRCGPRPRAADAVEAASDASVPISPCCHRAPARSAAGIEPDHRADVTATPAAAISATRLLSISARHRAC